MKDWLERSGFCFLILLLSIFPTFSAVIIGSADQHLMHHIDFFKANSAYFNPWQYRVLSPIIVEGFHQILSFTLFKILPTNDPYNLTFEIFRTGQHLLIFFSVWKLYNYFTQNKYLRFFSLIFLSGAFAAAAYGSDFAMNTYFDLYFFILAVLIIYSGKNILWFLPLTFFAAANRETSLLLPFLLFLDYRKFLSAETAKRYWSVFLGSLFIYALVFILIRLYYGYQPPAPIGREIGWPILSYNLTDIMTLFVLFATLSVLPLVALFNIQKVSGRLQLIFWIIVPAWFGVHFYLVWARETRLFLVPLTIVFIPIMLDLIQKEFEKIRNQ